MATSPMGLFGATPASSSSPQGQQGPTSPSGVQPDQQGPAPSQEGMSAGRQLITQVAQVHSQLKNLARTYPEMSEAIDKAIGALKEGMSKSIGSMQTKGSEGGSPPNA